jgi:hypothetical protein
MSLSLIQFEIEPINLLKQYYWLKFLSTIFSNKIIVGVIVHSIKISRITFDLFDMILEIVDIFVGSLCLLCQGTIFSLFL